MSLFSGSRNSEPEKTRENKNRHTCTTHTNTHTHTSVHQKVERNKIPPLRSELYMKEQTWNKWRISSKIIPNIQRQREHCSSICQLKSISWPPQQTGVHGRWRRQCHPNPQWGSYNTTPPPLMTWAPSLEPQPKTEPGSPPPSSALLAQGLSCRLAALPLPCLPLLHPAASFPPFAPGSQLWVF